MSAFPDFEDWAAEFAESTPFSFLPDPVKEGAPGICAEFLRQARAATEAEMRRLLLDVMPALDLPPEERAAVPQILGALLAWLEDTGRLGGGRALGLQVGALGSSYQERCAPG